MWLPPVVASSHQRHGRWFKGTERKARRVLCFLCCLTHLQCLSPLGRLQSFSKGPLWLQQRGGQSFLQVLQALLKHTQESFFISATQLLEESLGGEGCVVSSGEWERSYCPLDLLFFCYRASSGPTLNISTMPLSATSLRTWVFLPGLQRHPAQRESTLKSDFCSTFHSVFLGTL